MESNIGIACGACDTFSPMGTERCPACGHDLSLFTRPTGPASSPMPVAGGAPPPKEEAMEQSRFYVCKECSTPVPSGHKFCGACGATVPKEILDQQVEFFGAVDVARARLSHVRSTMQETEGLSYLLQGEQHYAGSDAPELPFGNDDWVSSRHANFFYRDDKLIVKDEDSKNGVYVRVRQPARLAPGEHFLCGEQVFRLDATPRDSSGPGSDQTYFYSSPKRPSPFRVVQVLAGGADGMVYCARENEVQIGRDDCDMNFPDDVYMSGKHGKVELNADGTFSLVDLGSRNGSYIRIRGERELGHGDYVFIGRQLLRVELTA